MDWSTWWTAFASVFLFFQVVAAVALIIKRNDLADVAWGPGFPLAAWIAAPADLDLRQKVVLVFLTLWGVRLFLHVGLRTFSHKTEDVRYANWRREWGRTWWWRSYLQVFTLQPLILCLCLSPVLVVLSSPSVAVDGLFALGVALWIVGFFFEAVGDEQLRRFKSRPENKGRAMSTGLWSWSRHPNYFGEVTLWWGIYLIALEVPGSLWTIIAPLTLTFLILKVSGVTMLESVMNKRPGYEDYVRRTSAFIPWPPRK